MQGLSGRTRWSKTFGSQLVYVKAPAAGQVNLPPSDGLRFFGQVQMTVTLKDVDDRPLWPATIAPKSI
jgi:alkaline phosphatase D